MKNARRAARRLSRAGAVAVVAGLAASPALAATSIVVTVAAFPGVTLEQCFEGAGTTYRAAGFDLLFAELNTELGASFTGAGVGNNYKSTLSCTRGRGRTYATLNVAGPDAGRADRLTRRVIAAAGILGSAEAWVARAAPR